MSIEDEKELKHLRSLKDDLKERIHDQNDTIASLRRGVHACKDKEIERLNGLLLVALAEKSS